MDIWPVTVPKWPSRTEVEMLSLPVESFLNPGEKAQSRVEKVAKCGLGALVCCMMRKGIHIPWTMPSQLYIPLEFAQTTDIGENEEEIQNQIKN